MELTFKPVLAATKPYPIIKHHEYLKFLSDQKKDLSDGNIAVYLAHRVIKDDQELFFPFIDIDGDSNLEGDDKIESATQNLLMTYKILEKLGVANRFKFIATGGTGFRAISNILINEAAHNAFVDFVKLDMPHIWDRQPTTDTETPFQLFAYKGNPIQNKKELVDRHSVYIQSNQIRSEILTVPYYKLITDGKLDPDKTIEFVKWLFDGTQISDLNALGQFGQRLLQYQQLSEKLNINPFKYTQLRKQTKPIALEVMQEMLLEKGFVSTIKHRGRNLALSFAICPACGEKSGNARAYPPYYTLKCFRRNCPAFEGLPLIKWAEIGPGGYHNYEGKKSFDLRPPSEFVAIDEARQKITYEIISIDNSYIIVTPGVGKTYQAVLAIVEMAKNKIIIYSTVSKKLQLEVFELAKKFSGDKNLIHLLQAREDCCKREEKLNEITKKGFSPAELLCSSCNHRNVDCSYYQQRANFDNGVYFVTHQMLMYLEERIPYPDLIILDENIKSGFFLKDSCSREQMLSIHKIQDDKASILLDKLMELSDEIVKNLFKGDIS